MPDNSQKTPFQPKMNGFALRKVQDQLQLEGKALPCQVTKVTNYIVTVSFLVSSSYTLPPVTVPIATSRYARPPTQVGDRGVVRPIDTYLGGVSGLGGGTANLTQRGNLSTLVFEPVSNAAWVSPDPNAYLLTAPNGVIAQTDDGTALLKVSEAGIMMMFGGHSVLINSTGVVIDGHIFDAHVHSNGNMGGNTGGVV